MTLFKERSAFILYLLVGAACLLALAASRTPRLLKSASTADRAEYGDLYDMCKVADFKIPLRNQVPPSVYVPVSTMIKDSPTHRITDAQIIFYGDSYFHVYFGGLFEHRTGVPAFCYYARGLRLSPLSYLASVGYIRQRAAKYFVMGLAERHTSTKVLDVESRINRESVIRVDDEIKGFMADPASLEFVLTEGQVSGQLLEFRNTLKFRLFDEMSRNIPRYTINPPMLYHKDDVESFHLLKDDTYVDNVADLLSHLKDELQKRYNLRLILVPIPNKYAICGARAFDDPYDDFLPRLYKRLDDRGVVYVNLYDDFMRSPDLLYYQTDTHWDQLGINIALDKLEALYRSQSGTAYLVH